MACDEDSRAQVIAAHGIDALEDDPELAAIARFASQLCEVPVASITIVEAERQLFLAREGIEERETPRSTSFCATTMLGKEPLVVTDASGDPRFADFAVVTGPMNLRFYAGAPLVAEDGTPLGALCVLDSVPRPDGLTPLQVEGLKVLAQCVVQRMTCNRVLLKAASDKEESQARLRTVIDSMPQIAWSSDNQGRFDYFNARWHEVTGREPPSVTAEWEPALHPDDWDAVVNEWSERLASNEVFEAQYRLLQADGTYRWVMSKGVPLIDANSDALRWYGTITDIEESHREAEARELLTGELSHRIKNIFAVISSLVSLTSRNRPEAKDYTAELSDKIRALGRAHDFVHPSSRDKGNSLHGLLEVLLQPYANNGAKTADDSSGGRVAVVGGTVPVNPRSATPLALVFHEFATNAAKYGALSVPDGKITVSIANKGDQVEIEWCETNGPEPDGNDRVGFGSRLVEMTVTSQLRGELVREMRPEGFVARLTLPITAL